MNSFKLTKHFVSTWWGDKWTSKFMKFALKEVKDVEIIIIKERLLDHYIFDTNSSLNFFWVDGLPIVISYTRTQI